MKAKTIATSVAAALLGLNLFVAVETVRAADPTPVDLVNALNAVFGKPQGTRSAHTKGFCLTGKFTPSPDAAKLSKAAHFAKPVLITARFSLGGGNPQAPDNIKGNVRGLAVRFDLGQGATTDLVIISAPVFFAKTPALFVEFLQTVGSGDKRSSMRSSPRIPNRRGKRHG
jgi:catalase